MVEINLFFWKVAIIRYSKEFNNNFSCYRDGRDTVLHLGRFEFYIIPRKSVSFFL